jgi:hypothetical protein
MDGPDIEVVVALAVEVDEAVAEADVPRVVGDAREGRRRPVPVVSITLECWAYSRVVSFID